ncbi:MAG: MMPL family transporter, partial [Thermoanaerobaculia bacterium]|nr:MMPL family transporter [Thermoanaerobaculia bacterium]
MQRDFGRDDNRLVLHVHGRDVFDAASVDYLRRLRAALEGVDGLDRIDDLVSLRVPSPTGVSQLLPSGADLAAARRRALDHPLVRGRLVSADAGATLVSATVAADRMGFAALRPTVEATLAAVASVPLPAGLEVGVIGIPLARVTLVDRLVADQLTYLPVCLVLFVLVLWLLYRDPRAVAVPLAAVLVSLVFVAGAMGLAGVPIDIINNVLPTLLLVIGVSDAIHLVSRYRQELAHGVAAAPALRSTCTHLSVAVFLTSLTTAIGFASLTVGGLDILSRFGLWAAGGVMLTWVVTIGLVPLVLDRLKPILGTASLVANRRAEAAADRLARFTVERRWPILAAGVLLLGLSGWAGSRVRVENSLFESFPDDDPMVVANREMEERFPGIVPISVVVSWDEGVDILAPEAVAHLEDVVDELRRRPEVSGVTSILDLLAAAAAAIGADGHEAPLRESPDRNRALEALVRRGLSAAGEDRLLA